MGIPRALISCKQTGDIAIIMSLESASPSAAETKGLGEEVGYIKVKASCLRFLFSHVLYV